MCNHSARTNLPHKTEITTGGIFLNSKIDLLLQYVEEGRNVKDITLLINSIQDAEQIQKNLDDYIHAIDIGTLPLGMDPNYYVFIPKLKSILVAIRDHRPKKEET